jgi:WD40-like Beta Propeller Repeat
MRNNKCFIPLLVLLVTALCHCTPTGQNSRVDTGNGLGVLSPSDRLIWQKLLAEAGPAQARTDLTLDYPYDGAVFPPEMAAPTFRWTDRNAASRQWLVVCRFRDAQNPVYTLADTPRWTPDRTTWEQIKARSVASPAEVAVFGVHFTPERVLTSQGRIHISTSKDRVDASVFYRQVPLPFKTGPRALKQMQWRLGDIASYGKPAVVMKNMSTCASCHTFSKDSRLISMEMNYKGDSGAQFIAPLTETIVLSKKNFMTWSDFPKPDLLPQTRGVFAKLSPGGNYMVGTVNEISFFALTNDPDFCQLFFPTYGILAWYDVDRRDFYRLPGADDPEFVQTDPSWSWDEKYVVFARARSRNEYHDDITDIRTRIEDADIHALNRKYPIQFDLYRVPFNQGRGGVAEPLQGASHNGMSNYFARYSPDGRWIVFTRSKSGIMLQPDSELYIIPAAGGKARRMRCNRERFNSWHSFSPNGRWMLFCSKVNSAFTEIFLTHIDENGMDSPPVCLSRFSDSRYAANVPEFVNLPAGAIRKIVIADD